MKTQYIYQIKLKGVACPQTIVSDKEIVDWDSNVEWWRLIGKVKRHDIF